MRFSIVKNKSGQVPPQSSCDFLPPGGTIGRSVDNNLVLPDEERAISRLQAIVHISADGECRITNRGNVTRVLLNDIPLERGRQVELQDGDVLGIDDYQIEVSALHQHAAPQAQPVAKAAAVAAAAAPAANINRSFKEFGWCTAIRGVESGGAVENLPCHTFPSDDGGVDMKCPTEIAISDRREAELAKNGFMPLVHRKNSDFAAFIGAQSLQKPAEYYDADASANAQLSARLPYLFACCRFAHYLKCIVRDKIGSFRERDDMERWLNDWIMNYVDGDPANSSQETKSRKPLAAAEVQVEEIEDNPGYYSAKFFLRPHYQLEGLTVSLRLVSKLPSLKQNDAS